MQDTSDTRVSAPGRLAFSVYILKCTWRLLLSYPLLHLAIALSILSYCIQSNIYLKSIFENSYLWLNDTSDKARWNIITALITVIGFIVSYIIGVRSWKTTRYQELKLSAAEDITSNTKNLTDALFNISFYISTIIRFIENDDRSKIYFYTRYINEKRAEIFDSSNTYLVHCSDGYHLISKYSTMLIIDNVFEKYKSIIQMYSISKNYADIFLLQNIDESWISGLNQNQIEEYKAIAAKVTEIATTASQTSGRIREKLMACIYPLTYRLFLHKISNYKEFRNLHNDYKSLD